MANNKSRSQPEALMIQFGLTRKRTLSTSDASASRIIKTAFHVMAARKTRALRLPAGARGAIYLSVREARIIGRQLDTQLDT